MMFALCAECGFMVDPDKCWIADEGVLCGGCCKKKYPARFAEASTKDSPDNFNVRTHYHDWKKYVGLREVYEYCDCGEVRR